MPYPAKVNRESLIEKAVEMIESEGVGTLSLSRLAAEFGIKAPSLYRHVANKTMLMQAVMGRTIERLFDVLNAALVDGAADPFSQLEEIAAAYRSFAHQNPNTYMLAMSNTDDEARPDEDYLVGLVLPLQAIIAEITGEENSLAALRGLLALMHGYVSLELTQQLRRGGDLGEVYTMVVCAYLRGWD